MTYDLGRICPKIRGNYSSSTTYALLDIVYYNGSSYICKADNTKNKVPTNTTYWQMMAAAGEVQTVLTPAQIQQIVNQVLQEGVVVDPEYATFKTTTQQAIENYTAPGNGILNIKRNNVSVGTFTANQSNNTDVNITVPTKLSQMSDYESFVAQFGKGAVEVRDDVDNTTFEKVETGLTVLWGGAIKTLTIQNLMPLSDVGGELPSHIIFDVEEDFVPIFPETYYLHDCANFIEDAYTCMAGKHYEFEIFGDHVIVRNYAQIGG